MNKLVSWLLILVILSGCRSRKEAIRESFDEFTSDTTTLVSSGTSVTNINESSHSLRLSDETGERIEFQEIGGEIHFHPDGSVTMTGVSAYGIKNRKSATELTSQLSVRDSISSVTQTESSQKNETKLEKQTDTPTATSNTSKWILLITLTLLTAILLSLFIRRKQE